MSIQARIEKFWYSKSKLRFAFLPFHYLFSIIALVKKTLYKIGFLKVNRFDIPVVVIGNITVGGTGKTPFIRFIVKQLIDKGLRVGIVSRGYQATVKTFPHRVTPSDFVDMVGDEAYMQCLHFHNNALNVPIVIDPNRSCAVDYLVENEQLDIIISDDGLQHYKMSRDFEVLMIDGKRGLGNQLMLPFGPLREPASRLKSTHVIIENAISGSSSKIQADLNPIQMKANFNQLVQLSSGKSFAFETMSDKKIIAVAGIGNPQRFFDSLKYYYNFFEEKVFPDHHAFQATDFECLNSDIVIMTEKDAVKCQGFAQENWYYLSMEAYIDEDQFEPIYQSLQAIIEASRGQ